MKNLMFPLAVLLILVFSLQGVAAQSDGTATPVVMPDTMDAPGLVSAYDRTYMIDFAALMASPSAEMASPAADMASPAAASAMPVIRMVSITGMTFESADSAEAYVNDLTSQIQDAEKTGQMPEGTEVKELEEIDNDGFIATVSMGDMGFETAIIVFVDGDQVFMIVGLDADVESATALVTGIARHVAEAEVETADVSFSEDGTSTGGVFDRMPEVGSDLVSDLPSVTDTILKEAGE